MTIGTTASTVTYIGNGVTTSFTFSFVGASTSDIEVIYTNSSGAETVLSPSVYTLVFNAIAPGTLWAVGGTVTYPNVGSPISAGTTLTINRMVPYTQTVSISNQGAFYPQAIEQGLDLLELQIQQLVEDSSYAIRAPFTDPVPPNVLPSAVNRANGFLAFDSSGQPIIVFSNSTTFGSATTRKVVTTGTATIGMTLSDSFGGISVYQSGTSATTIQLPSGAGPYPIFDGSLNASSFPLTVLPPAGLTILGQTSYVLPFNGQSSTFYSDGSQILIG